MSTVVCPLPPYLPPYVPYPRLCGVVDPPGTQSPLGPDEWTTVFGSTGVPAVSTPDTLCPGFYREPHLWSDTTGSQT